MSTEKPTPVFTGLSAETAVPVPGSAVEERVIVGIDGSMAAQAALRWALRYARRTGSPVEAVAVWQVPPPQLGAPTGAMIIADDMEAVARKWLDEAAAGAGVQPDGGVQLLVVHGDPVEVLLERARGAALMVLGNKGRGAVAATVMGAVPQRCLHHAVCPVVLVPASST